MIKIKNVNVVYFDEKTFINMTITAPIYFWNVFPCNSNYQMKKLTDINTILTIGRKLTLEDFSCEKLSEEQRNLFISNLKLINKYLYLNQKHFNEGIFYNKFLSLLPSSFNETREIIMTENELRDMAYSNVFDDNTLSEIIKFKNKMIDTYIII